ncbi:aspartate carbamoyltransferase regulatory subunit [Peptostreptococcaceae bacterium AGR-M142]
MLKVESLKRGIVIDHIKAGCGYKIFKELKLHKVDFPVVLMKNISSKKLGRKDLIKIDNKIDIDLNVLGAIDPNMTINLIENSKIIDKLNLSLPKVIEGSIRCKNPRCITTIEDVDNIKFTLFNEENREYKCEYCDSLVSI